MWEALPSSFARVDVVDAHTLLAADVAAPVEDAMAFFFALLSPGVVASPAAQQVTTFDAMRRHVADPIACPKGAGLLVGLTEVGRAFVVHQVAFGGMLEEVVLDPQRLHPTSGLAVLLHHHLRGAVVLVLQVVAKHAEVWLCPPASLHLAASRQTMTLAAQVHVVENGLRSKKRHCIFTST